MPQDNRFRIDEALKSYASLNKLIDSLSEQEVFQCLTLEANSRRRQTLIDRLIQRAVRLNELSYNRQLKEKFHGSPSLKNPVSR